MIQHTPHKAAPDTAYESNPFKVIFAGFNKLFIVNQTWAIIIIVVGALAGGAQFFQNFMPRSSVNFSGMPHGHDLHLSHSALVTLIAVGVVLASFIALISIVINVIYNGAVAYVAYQTTKGQTVTFGEAIHAALNKFWTLLWLRIIVTFKVFVGILFFVIPGVRAMLRYNMASLAVYAEDQKARGAIQTMKHLTKDHLLEIFGMATAAGIIPVVGPAFLIGGQIVMYPQLKALKASGAPKPAVHWLNYLGLILPVGLLLLLILIGILIAVLIG